MPTSMNEPPAPPSMSEHAYLGIREGVISGRFGPGQRLRERDLSVQLSVSRIPVREALGRLEAEGFVVTRPRRGAHVRQLTLKDMDELFDLRLSLEVLAARQAATRVVAGADVAALNAQLLNADEATISGDERRIREANTALHAEIVTLSGNSMLAEVMVPIVGRLMWLFALTKDRDPEEQCREHHGLCNAIQEGNPELAAALAYSHIELGREPSLRALGGILLNE